MASGSRLSPSWRRKIRQPRALVHVSHLTRELEHCPPLGRVRRRIRDLVQDRLYVFVRERQRSPVESHGSLPRVCVWFQFWANSRGLSTASISTNSLQYGCLRPSKGRCGWVVRLFVRRPTSPATSRAGRFGHRERVRVRLSSFESHQTLTKSLHFPSVPGTVPAFDCDETHAAIRRASPSTVETRDG